MTQAPWFPRVRPVAAAALQLAAKRTLDVSLTEAQASALIEPGGIESVLAALRDRMRVRRVVQGIELIGSCQVDLAVTEVVALAAGGTEGNGSRKNIAAVIEGVARAARPAAQLQSEYESVQQLLREAELKGKRFRQFVRVLSRTREVRLNELRASVFDESQKRLAESELDELFSNVLRKALASPDLLQE